MPRKGKEPIVLEEVTKRKPGRPKGSTNKKPAPKGKPKGTGEELATITHRLDGRLPNGHFAPGNTIRQDTAGPEKYRTLESLQAAIDSYFDVCAGKVLLATDENGSPVLDENGAQLPVLDKYGQPIVFGAKPPTVTGLALHLGFTTRNELLKYAASDDKGNERYSGYARTIREAKSRCEAYAEARLFDRDGAMGAKFSLSNNFEGWTERPDDGAGKLDISINVVKPE